jgi:hypothetical protein
MAMNDSKNLTRPGYWCERVIHTPATEFGTRTVSASVAFNASDAMTWVYIAMKINVRSLPEDEAQTIAQWLEQGRQESLRRLMNGEPFSIAISEGHTRVEWSIRRVIFLPLFNCHHRSPTHNL